MMCCTVPSVLPATECLNNLLQDRLTYYLDKVVLYLHFMFVSPTSISKRSYLQFGKLSPHLQKWT